ncbi:hypothetical protein [Actinophytocola sediminis]
MSSMGIGQVAVGAVVGGAVVVGGAAWLAAKGVRVGALVAVRSVGALGAGLSKVGDQAELRAAQWAADNAAQLAWETAARQVIDVNARLDVLARHAPELAARLPATLDPCAQSPAELTAWCATTSATITALEQELAARAAAATVSVLRHTVDLDRPVTAAEAFDQYHQALAAKASAVRAPGVDEDIARVLGRLSPTVTAADRAEVLAAASQVTVPRPDVDQHTLLDQLRLSVQRANQRARVRQEDAITAATMLAAIPAEPADAERTRLRTDLADVLAARRAFDEPLRTRSARAAAVVREELEQQYVLAAMTDSLDALGYQLDTDYSTTVQRVRLVRPDWPEHAVQLVLDGDQVRDAVIRRTASAGTNARREDYEHEQQWCADKETLQSIMDDHGLRMDRTELAEPGERLLPVATRAHRPATADRPETRELS